MDQIAQDEKLEKPSSRRKRRDVTPVKTGAQNMDWVPAFAGMTTLRDVKGEEETIYVMETH